MPPRSTGPSVPGRAGPLRRARRRLPVLGAALDARARGGRRARVPARGPRGDVLDHRRGRLRRSLPEAVEAKRHPHRPTRDGVPPLPDAGRVSPGSAAVRTPSVARASAILAACVALAGAPPRAQQEAPAPPPAPEAPAPQPAPEAPSPQ